MSRTMELTSIDFSQYEPYANCGHKTRERAVLSQAKATTQPFSFIQFNLVELILGYPRSQGTIFGSFKSKSELKINGQPIGKIPLPAHYSMNGMGCSS